MKISEIQNDLSNRALAKKLKVSEASIRKWKLGGKIPPYIVLLIECMKKLGKL